ncbi:hypothetical protein [Salinigranum halophilum]|jgi:hypothetical protein|uniref:hypothetical protein n=1 Tax=Salinigranum halophilum TaxID=2565931 RepID=UPI00115CF9AB|nr:hypothetical protein [Salinigranum halophilum]
MDRTPTGLTDDERTALHELQLGVEGVHRAYGHLLAFHHAIGRSMDHFAAAEPLLRESGHTAYADAIRDDHLPAGVVGDRWSYEVVEAFESGFLTDVTAFEARARSDLADGQTHVAERVQQQAWRERAQD